MLLTFIKRQHFAVLSRQYYKANIGRYFKNDEQLFKKHFKRIQQITVSKGLPQPTTRYSKYLLKYHPKVLFETNIKGKQFEKRLEFLKQLQSKNQMGPPITKIIFQNKNLLVNMTQKQIIQFCQCLLSHGFNQQQAETFLKTYPNTVNEKLRTHIEQKFRLFRDYLQLTNQECVKLFTKNGFLIPSSSKRIQQSIVYLRSLSMKDTHNPFITKDQIINLAFQNGELLLMGRKNIQDTIRTYKYWGVTEAQLWSILIKNPLLFTNGPYDVMPLKRKLFKYFSFTAQMGREMLTKYPLVLLSSVNSLQAKLIFIKERLKLPINIKTLQLLCFKFSLIRPRGDLLVRAKINYTLYNIVDQYIKVTDEQFVKKINISIQKYNEEKQRFKQTEELDFRRKKILKTAKIDQKIKEKVNQLRNEL